MHLCTNIDTPMIFLTILTLQAQAHRTIINMWGARGGGGGGARGGWGGGGSIVTIIDLTYMCGGSS